MRSPASSGPRALLTRLADPLVLLPLLSILVLGVIWSATFNLIKIARTDAQAAALGKTRELLSTYEAQVVRAVREIDQTLKIVN